MAAAVKMQWLFVFSVLNLTEPPLTVMNSKSGVYKYDYKFCISVNKYQ